MSTIDYGSIDKREGQPKVLAIRRASIVPLCLVGFSVILVVVIASALSLIGPKRRAAYYMDDEIEIWSSPQQTHRTLWFKQQRVDHVDPSNNETWKQRYFEYGRFFGGPGHPIFVIIGGEDNIAGLVYPFVWNNLARSFGAHTCRLEHRFYGESFPLPNATNKQLQQLLNVEQALEDVRQFIAYKRQKLGCSLDKTSRKYCPVMTVGGSYPGFLSALMRIHYPDEVDIAYAASAPLLLYSQDVPQEAYFEKVTAVAEWASPGCPHAVRSTQHAIRDRIQTMSVVEAARKLGICTDTIPDYITNIDIFLQELVFVLATHFADANMDYYPPGPDTSLAESCRIFQDRRLSDFERIRHFLFRDTYNDCYDLRKDLPWGPNATITAGDWSGVGGDESSYSWDFQSCELIQACGFSEKSMFLPRAWTLDWLTQHCKVRFGVTPAPKALLQKYNFNNLTGVSRIIFSNGLHDGWSVASIEQAPPGSFVKVYNYPNGAHHSVLNHVGPRPQDTNDIKAAYRASFKVLREWLDEIYDGQGHH